MSIVWPVDRLAHTASVKTISPGCTGFLVRAQCCTPAKKKNCLCCASLYTIKYKVKYCNHQRESWLFLYFLVSGNVAGSISQGLNSIIHRESFSFSFCLLWADLDQTGSPAWSAAGRTGGALTDQGCPCAARHTPVHAGGASVQQPSLGGYLREGQQRDSHTHSTDEAHCWHLLLHSCHTRLTQTQRYYLQTHSLFSCPASFEILCFPYWMKKMSPD